MSDDGVTAEPPVKAHGLAPDVVHLFVVGLPDDGFPPASARGGGGRVDAGVTAPVTLSSLLRQQTHKGFTVKVHLVKVYEFEGLIAVTKRGRVHREKAQGGIILAPGRKKVKCGLKYLNYHRSLETYGHRFLK
mgnify:CR=1 FL=1